MYTMALAYKAQEITHATVHTTVPCWELLDVIATFFDTKNGETYSSNWSKCWYWISIMQIVN